MFDVQFIGPPLDAGPLPAVFYFALSANDSLFLDPFNQPVTFLKNSRLRIFSITLPGHDHLPPTKAFHFWSSEMKNGKNPIDPFIDEVVHYIQTLYSQNIIHSCAVMGLSRGVFIAAHVAAKLKQIQVLLGFAPLTKLSNVAELQEIDTSRWDLIHLSSKLYDKKIRCYIGNRDTRVGTDHCFNWLYELASQAYEKGIRTSPIELQMTSSIGREGHGTAPETFEDGARWLLECIDVS